VERVPAVEFRHIDKSFGAVAALRDVGFTVNAGEAHAIVGENGAGKSTLLKILAGSLSADRGGVHLNGEAVTLASPHAALARGIGFVHQEMLAFPSLSVTANIFAGRERTAWCGWLREAEMRARARELLARLHVPVSPDALAGALPLAYRQLLQVARALAFDCRTLALDEPTTSLTAAETDHLFRILEGLRESGVTLIYVSHRLPEVFRLCDRITALRDGRYVRTFQRAAATTDDVVQAMVGRVIPPRAADAAPRRGGGPGLRVHRLTRRPCFEDVSLSIDRGEVVGLFGLVGSGRTELLETVVGVHRHDSGSVEVGGRATRFRSPREAAQAGVVLVPEDRQRQGLFFNLSLRHNLVLPSAEARRSRVVRESEREMAAQLLRRWRVAAPSVDATPDVLSGGNQQKVVAAKWLVMQPRVLLLDEPTKGVDIGAKYEIHAMVREMAAEGVACLLVSSDLTEVLALADRLIVMREGRIRGEVAGGAPSFTEEQVMNLAATTDGAGA
jgi:rhamnose transport system ATP-binding protein